MNNPRILISRNKREGWYNGKSRLHFKRRYLVLKHSRVGRSGLSLPK